MTIGNCASTLAAASVVNAVIKDQGYAGYVWFWYSLIGVFGFEVIIQNINVTFLNQGVLTLSTWINKAADAAAASIIRYAADSDVDEKQKIAETLVKKAGAQLQTYALQTLGANSYNQLATIMNSNPGIDPHLFLALALAEHDPKKARAIIKAK